MPTVKGFKPSYRVGDVLNMTCSLADTFPAANLTWFISGEKVPLRHSWSSFKLTGLIAAFVGLL